MILGLKELEDHFALRPWRLELLRRSPGRHTEILEYQSLARSCPVIVKRITSWKKREHASAAIVREFESLRAVRRQLPAQLVDTVPRPLMVLPESAALVMEQLQGKPLSLILKLEANRLIGPLRGDRMVVVGQLAGLWLSQLHQATRTAPLYHDSNVFLDTLDERLVRCQTLGVKNNTIDELRRLICDASHQMDGHPIPAAARQGDFTPQNILIEGNRLGVVDFESFSESDSIYEDVSTFAAYIQALSTFPYYSQSALLRLADSFLQAYGVAGDEPALRLSLARSFVVLISEMNAHGAVFCGQKRVRFLQSQLDRVCAELARL
jgi:hypothetical protein